MPDANAQQTPTATARVIAFSRLGDEYGFLSNFARTPITLNDAVWPTVEHYYQAQKFAGTAHAETIRRARSPKMAARKGRSPERPLRPDWEAVKDDVMLEALRAKFTQHADLRARLLATGDATLVEHRAKDAYWGDGPDGTGKNMLGQLLMRVRGELTSAPNPTEPTEPTE